VVGRYGRAAEHTGDVETDAIVIIGIGSKIWNQDGELMDLPWRQ
jgi:hypothetical protein